MKKLLMSMLAVMLMTLPGCASSKKTVTKTKEVTKQKTERKETNGSPGRKGYYIG